MTEIKCEHCNKEFKSNKILLNHQKKTKYCLVLQGKFKKEEEKNGEDIYMCVHCTKTFCSKYSLDSHVINCKLFKLYEIENCKEQLYEQEQKYKEQLLEQEEKYKEQLLEQEEKYKEQLALKDLQIKELQDKMERICVKAIEKPTKISNTINATTNNIVFLNLSEDEIHEKCLNFSPETCQTLKDIAEYTVTNILTNDDGELIYNCTDASRHMFKFTDSNGKTVKDPNATKLISKIKPVFNRKCVNLKDRIANHVEDKEHDLSKTRNLYSKEIMRKELGECKDYQKRIIFNRVDRVTTVLK